MRVVCSQWKENDFHSWRPQDFWEGRAEGLSVKSVYSSLLVQWLGLLLNLPEHSKVIFSLGRGQQGFSPALCQCAGQSPPELPPRAGRCWRGFCFTPWHKGALWNGNNPQICPVLPTQLEFMLEGNGRRFR